MNVTREGLGEFEQLALLAVYRLGKEAYGTTIREAIEHATERNISIGALYTTLDRLENKGYVSSEVGEPTPERGGRAKRYFTITASGVGAMKRAVQAVRNLLPLEDI
jgi:PadR family transcriptional regulator, regulatory protein PadR